MRALNTLYQPVPHVTAFHAAVLTLNANPVQKSLRELAFMSLSGA
ncbi:hypothetical protein SFK1770_5492 [Shigella flexneri K-1770]|nr:hypothetical protein SFK1770_5492 [Shigella flexneri K-1770]